MSGEVERTEDVGSDAQAQVSRWLREIQLSTAHEKDWRNRAEKIVKRYRDDDRKSGDEDSSARFNILFANTEVLKGVMYQRQPVPDVRRRFLDKDPLARQASQILQRSLSFSIDAYDFDGLMESCVEDVLLPGRGIAAVKYVPTMGMVDVPQTDGTVVQEERVVYEAVECEYVEWEMFRMSPAKRWSKVRWVAFGKLLTRDDLVKQFGDKGKACSLDWAPKDKENENDEMFKRALVWTIWDKTAKKVISVSKGYTQAPLLEVDDPLQLEGFYPIPKPVYSISTTNSLIPVPEYVQYQDQAIELERVTERIDHLIDGLRRRGLYDATYAEIEKLKDAGDNEFIPVENFANIAEKGGVSAAIYEEPIETISKVLTGLYVQRDQVKATIYEITGIADIVRGATKATETLGAQELKARYANVRVAPRQKRIANFARDLFRLKAEIIATKFSPETLKLMTGPDLWVIEQDVPGPDGQPVRQKVDATQQIMELLRNDRLRGFRVDVETDSTVQPDADTEQKNRTEFIGGVTQFLTAAAPAVQSGAMPIEVAKEFLSFAARAFKVSPQLEDALDKLGGDQGAAKAQKDQQQQVQQAMQGAEVQVKQAEAGEAGARAREADAKAREAEAKAAMAEFELQMMMQGKPMPGEEPKEVVQ